jgi:signal peptidase I
VDTDRSEREGDEGEPESARTRWRLLVELPVLVLIAAVVAVIVKAFVAQAFFIPSSSMEPQLQVGDRVLVSRVSYRLHEPRRGDIVVFGDQEVIDDGGDRFILLQWGRDALEAVGLVRPEDSDLIKRVIGLPGERIEARAGTVFIDGRPLIEPYLPDSVVQGDFGPVEVPDDHYFVLGDNRAFSADSRRFGPVPADAIVGRAIAIIWPPNRAGYL